MRFALLLAAALASASCTTSRLSLDELPSQPIALAYWDEDEARRRAQLQAERERAQPQAEGVADVESLGRFLGAPDESFDAGLRPGRLILLNPATLELTPVSAAPPGSRPLAWSEDHRRLLFSTNRGGEYYHLYEYDLDAQEVRSLTYGKRSYGSGDFGPDGRFVYFGWERGADGDYAAVYTTRAGGSDPRVLFEHEIVEDLSWSPDGKHVVYTRIAPRPRRDGSRMRHIVRRSTETPDDAKTLATGRSATLSPDGEWILYSAPLRDGGWQLRRMRFDGSSRTALGKASLRDELDPAISPDGRFVAYTGDEHGITRLFIRRFDGTGDRVLLTEGVGANPVW